jgi:phosphatidylglycerophosphate synthase
MPSVLAADVRSAPNLISLTRIAMIFAAAPLLVYRPVIGVPLAVLAGIFDYLDGMVARATGKVSRLGEILDQFADLCFESLILLVAIQRGFFPFLLLFAYLFREFWVLSIRRYMASVGLNIPSTLAGKLKSNFIEWGFLPCFVSMAGWWPQLEPAMAWIGRGAVCFGIFVGWVSGVDYTRAFIAGYNATARSAPRPVPGPEIARKG